RLSDTWDDGSFAFSIVICVLRGGIATDAVSLAAPGIVLCRRTDLSGFQPPTVSPDDEQRIIATVSPRRIQAFQEAVLLAEMRADTDLQEFFIEAASLDSPQERDVRQQIVRKLLRLYG